MVTCRAVTPMPLPATCSRFGIDNVPPGGFASHVLRALLVGVLAIVAAPTISYGDAIVSSIRLSPTRLETDVHVWPLKGDFTTARQFRLDLQFDGYYLDSYVSRITFDLYELDVAPIFDDYIDEVVWDPPVANFPYHWLFVPVNRDPLTLERTRPAIPLTIFFTIRPQELDNGTDRTGDLRWTEWGVRSVKHLELETCPVTKPADCFPVPEPSPNYLLGVAVLSLMSWQKIRGHLSVDRRAPERPARRPLPPAAARD